MLREMTTTLRCVYMQVTQVGRICGLERGSSSEVSYWEFVCLVFLGHSFFTTYVAECPYFGLLKNPFW
jgi:hypothetical protein